MTSDRDLLARYANDGSREALGQLAARYLDMVYAAARRQVGGNAALAEDVTQAVFLMFASKAPALRDEVIVPAWLLRATWYASRNALRLQQRRCVHEARFAAMNSHSRAGVSDPASAVVGNDVDAAAVTALIDRALMSLRERDRAAVAMHYLRGQSFEQVAAALHTTPEAARKRIERAIAALRSRFAGVASVTPGAIASALTAAARVKAPSPLLTAVTSALAEPSTTAANAATLAAGATRMMAMAKVRLACWFALAAAVVVAVGIMSIVPATPHRDVNATRTALPRPATATASPASDGPLEALNRLATAVREGDGDTAKSLAAVTDPADRAFLDLASENIRLAGLYRSTYRDNFGAAAGDALPADWYPTSIPPDSRVSFNPAGDRATVLLREGSVPMVKVEGEWKVPSSFVTVESQGSWPSASPQALQLVRLNNLAYAETTHAIAQGRFKSPEQARADLRDRLARARAAAAIVAAERAAPAPPLAPAQPAGP